MAAPFVQGQLLGKTVSVVVKTVCAQSGRPLEFELDSHMDYRVVGEPERPMAFEPLVDWSTFDEANIVRRY